MFRNLTVTAIGVVVFLAMRWVPMPGIDHEALQWWLGSSGASLSGSFSLGALGLTPIISAYLIVEVVAFLHPRTRARRIGGHDARAPLRRASRMLALAFAAVQAWALSVSMQEIRVGYDTDVSVQPLVVVSSLLGAIALALLLAEWIDRHGLGNGLAALFIADLFAQYAPYLAFIPQLEDPAVPVTVTLIVCIGWSALLRPVVSGEAADKGRWPVLMPLCGIWPIRLSLSAGQLVIGLGLLYETRSFEVAVAVVLAVGLGFLFWTPGRVEGLWRRVRSDAAVRRIVIRAIGLSTLALVGVDVALNETGAWDVGLDLGLLLPVIAWLWDSAYEARFRSEHPDAVALDELHRTYACDPALALLAEAGVPAHIRGRGLRALFQALGPQFPMTILVPADQAEAAAEALAPLRA